MTLFDALLTCIHFHPTSLVVRSPITFTCPQQPNLKIPVSRLNDGVCDCCDGADEKSESGGADHCEDECGAIRAAAIAAKRAVERRYNVGSKQREAALEEYNTFTVETKTKLKQIYHDIKVKQPKKQEMETQLVESKRQYLRERVERIQNESLQMATTVSSAGKISVVSGLLDGLSTDELQWLIIYACQLAGEMPNNEEIKTCFPLRLAGLDTASVWDPETYKFRRVGNEDDVEQQASLADILYHNSQEGNKVIWKETGLGQDSNNDKFVKNKRRLTVVEADQYDDYPEDRDYTGEFDDYEGDDNEDENDSGHLDREIQQKGDSDGLVEGVGKRIEISKLILAQPVSQARSAFLKTAAAIVELIDKLKKESETKEEESGEEIEDGATEESLGSDEFNETRPHIADPMAIPMTRSALEQRKKRIQRGLDYAISAKVLLDAVSVTVGANEDELQQLLMRLAIGTLNHGQLSVVQFYQAFAAVVPELQNTVDNVKTCPSPWAGICPPRSLKRAVVVPPATIVTAVEEFCANALTTEPAPGTCTAEENTAGEHGIPLTVPDGYGGYYEVMPRTETDLLSQAFANLGYGAIGVEETARIKISEQNDAINQLKNEITDFEGKIRDMEGSIEPHKFGPDGELHSVHDKCFEGEQGKYVYEVCMFGAASQKDKGATSGSGTNLGMWREAVTENATDHNGQEYQQRVWKWEGGLKCWNGPQRSATAYVTCGAETRVLSADEPDTCRYVLQMESPLACDDEFRSRHGL